MITPKDVADHLDLPGVDTEGMTPAVDAVNAMVSQWKGYAPGDDWSPRHVLGATMLAATLYRRRNTPGGVENFNELGVTYVQRSDPHASMLLGLGAWTAPMVG